MSQAAAIAQLTPQIGHETYVSDWVTVGQDQVNTFADATGDHQWIHIDPARAAEESQYGATIAHGYLTLSLYPALRNLVNPDEPVFDGVKNVINYGLNKVRFPNALKVGARVRARVTLAGVEEVSGGLQVTEVYMAEIEGETKPACVAEAIMRYYF
ncbi:MAG: MaoC family dehydratase [Pseudomonadota bacterium]